MRASLLKNLEARLQGTTRRSESRDSYNSAIKSYCNNYLQLFFLLKYQVKNWISEYVQHMIYDIVIINVINTVMVTKGALYHIRKVLKMLKSVVKG